MKHKITKIQLFFVALLMVLPTLLSSCKDDGDSLSAGYLKVSAFPSRFSNSAGGTSFITGECSGRWTIYQKDASVESPFKFSALSGDGNFEVSITATQANSNFSDHVIDMYIASGDTRIPFTLTQAEGVPSLSIDKNSFLDIPKDDQSTATVALTTNMSWSVKITNLDDEVVEDGSIEVSASEGSGDSELIFTFTKNSNFEPRTYKAMISSTQEGLENQPADLVVTMTQLGFAQTTLEVTGHSDNSVALLADADDSRTLNVLTSMDAEWSVETTGENTDWLTVTPNVEDGTITLTANKENDYTLNSATITITAQTLSEDDAEEVVIEVTQLAKGVVFGLVSGATITDITKEANSTASVSFNSAIAWALKIIDDQGVEITDGSVVADITSGDGNTDGNNTDITFTFAQNSSFEPRTFTATITPTEDDLDVTPDDLVVTMTQLGYSATTLAVTGDTDGKIAFATEADAEGQVLNVTTSEGAAWDVVKSGNKTEWLTVNADKTAGTITLTTADNDYSLNSATLTISAQTLSAEDKKEVVIEVTQSAKGVVFELASGATITDIAKDANSTAKVSLKSEVAWALKITDDQGAEITDNSVVADINLGEGNAESNTDITFTFAQNSSFEPRTVKAVISTTEDDLVATPEDLVVTMTQLGYSATTLAVTGDTDGKVAFATEADATGKVLNITTSDGAAWSVETTGDNTAWLTVSADKTANTITLTTAADNTSVDTENTATITITAKTLDGEPNPPTKVITVTQAKLVAELSLSSEEAISLGSESDQTATVDVTCNTAWEIVIPDAAKGWLSAEVVNETTVTFKTLTANSVTTPNTADVVIRSTADNNVSKTIAVSQSGAGAELTLANTAVTVDETGALISTSVPSVTSNTTWTSNVVFADGDESWFDYSPTGADANETAQEISITNVQANPNSTVRTATITISATGVADQTITVTQAAKPTVTLTVPTEGIFSESVTGAYTGATGEFTVVSNSTFDVAIVDDDNNKPSTTASTGVSITDSNDAAVTSIDATEGATLKVIFELNKKITRRKLWVAFSKDGVVVEKFTIFQARYPQSTQVTEMLAVKSAIDKNGVLNWAADVELDQWDGLTLTELATPETTTNNIYTIDEINLANKNLTGEMPTPTVTNFKNLKVLNLGGNANLAGRVSNAYNSTNFPKLESINVSGTSVSIFNMTALYTTPVKRIEAQNAKITDAVTISNIFKSEHIEYIDISGNSIDQPLYPTTFNLDDFKATKLTYLDVSGNNISGTLHPKLAECANLETLKVAGNKMSGIINSKFATNPNFSKWDAVNNIYPQQTTPADAATDPSKNTFKFGALGAMRILYNSCGGENWTYTWGNAELAKNYASETSVWMSDDVFDVTESGNSALTIQTVCTAAGGNFPGFINVSGNGGGGEFVCARCSAAGVIESLGGWANGTANKITKMSGSLPIEIFMLGTISQIQLSESGIGGSIPTSAIKKLTWIYLNDCNIEQSVGDFFLNLNSSKDAKGIALLKLVNLANNKLSGELTSDMQTNIINNCSAPGWGDGQKQTAFTLYGNTSLTGALTDEFVTFLKSTYAFTDQLIYDKIMKGTQLTWANMPDEVVTETVK